MSAIDTLFLNLRARGQKAMMPFITAGDPDLDFTAAMLQELVKRGAALFELGIPYSDPIADGPVVQESYTRALAKKIKLADIFAMAGRVLPALGAPVVTMVSYAIVHRHGLGQYVDDALAAGIAGAIVPDLPVDEAESLAKICRKRDFSLVQLVTPTTPRERAVRITNTSTGFLYYVSVTGITGERTSLPPELVDNVAWLRSQTSLPICVGFGISQPEHARTLAPVADGLIVGSAVVKRIAAAEQRPRKEVIATVGEFVESLVQALTP
jgi:tryptophan synthase alpha chain